MRQAECVAHCGLYTHLARDRLSLARHETGVYDREDAAGNTLIDLDVHQRNLLRIKRGEPQQVVPSSADSSLLRW